MLMIAKDTTFTVSELLSENQQKGKITPPTQIRVKKNLKIFKMKKKNEEVKSELFFCLSLPVFHTKSSIIADLKYIIIFLIFLLFIFFRNMNFRLTGSAGDYIFIGKPKKHNFCQRLQTY